MAKTLQKCDKIKKMKRGYQMKQLTNKRKGNLNNKLIIRKVKYEDIE